VPAHWFAALHRAPEPHCAPSRANGYVHCVHPGAAQDPLQEAAARPKSQAAETSDAKINRLLISETYFHAIYTESFYMNSTGGTSLASLKKQPRADFV